MKNALAILGGAMMISLALYFGLSQSRVTPSATPPSLPDVSAPPPAVFQPPPTINREAIVNRLEIHLDDAGQLSRSIAEAFKTNQFSEVTAHADELVELAQQIRAETAELPRADSRVIRLLVNDLQHAAHELEAAAAARPPRHDEAHHALESLRAELAKLQGEVATLL